VQWLQNAVSQREMEFLAGRRDNQREIWNTLAPGLFSMLYENATEANSRTGEAAFNRLTIYPLHVMMAEKITNEILPAYGSERARPLLGQFEDVRVEDRDLKLREMDGYSRTHTIDEIREEYYGDEPIGDERGQLLVTQVNALSGGVQEPEEPETEPENEAEQEEPAEDTARKAALEELARYQRAALKRIGKPYTFASDILPAELLDGIRARLETCTSETAVKAVFDASREKLRGAKSARGNEIASLQLLLETAIRAMMKDGA
jgi:hypothetical protein